MIELMEIVVLLPNQAFCVLGVNSQELQNVLNVISDSLKKWLEKKESEMIMIQGCYGPGFFPNQYVQGFYVRVPHKDTQKQFQEKILEVAERQTKAAEKIAEDCSHGEDWK